MKLKLLLFLTVALLSFGFMHPEANVWAQTEQHCIDLVDYYPHSLITAGYSGSNTENCTDPWIGHGWRSCGSYFSYLYDFYARVGVRFDLPEGATRVISASASWSGMAVSGRWQIGWTSHNISFGTGNTATATVAQVNALPFPARLSYITLDLERRNLTESEANAGFIIDSFIVCYLGGAPLSEPEPEYYQPLSEIVAELPTIDGVSVSSPLPGAPVHAAADGTVTAIRPILRECINVDIFPCKDSDTVRLNTSNSYIIHLTTANTNFIYLVANAQNYVRVGLQITASCIIGETLAGNTREGYTSVGMDEPVVLELLPLSDSPPCSAVTPPSAPESCIEGSPLSSVKWRGLGVHEWVGDTVRLDAGASIRQISALTDDIPTQLTFKASKSEPDTEGSVTVVIGSGNYNFTLTTLPDQHQTPSAIHKSNASGFHELKITNTSQQTITIHSTCVQIKLGLLYPDDCYFVNHDFSRGAYGWYLSSGVISETGQVKIPIPQEESISQPVVIFAGDDGYAYTLDVMVKLWFYPEYQADRNSIDSVQLSFSFYDVGTPMVIGTETFGAFGDGDDVVTFSQSFMIEDDIEDDLQIQVDITTTDPDVRGIAIREVCLSPQDDNWIGYEDNLPTSQKPFFEICRANPMPSGLNIGKWFEWLMNGILNLFSCELMKVFNGFWDWVQWLQLSIVEGINWIGNTLLPWLGGHFFNLNFIQDIVRTIQPVFDVFEMIIDAGIGIFKQIIGVISSIATLIIELFNAWNDTTPISPPFLPNCNIAPETQNICILFWAIEVTVLDGQLGQLIIPMFSANIAVLGTIYFIKRFQRLFERSARNV